jgi:hypothetical protein
MADNKPWASYRNKEGENVDKTFPTYTKLRAAMKSMIVDSADGVVRVTRTRRGCWGQWFEQWEWNRKPVKIKETWL